MANKKFKQIVIAESGLRLPAEIAERALLINSSGNLASSAVTATELGHLSGVTSGVQSQINAKLDSSEKGAVNGVATLDGSGRIPSSQLTLDVIEYKGVYDASLNSPALANGTGTRGDLYRVTVAGTHNFGAGNITLAVGDKIVYNGTAYERWNMSDAVESVNSQTGAVVLGAGDLAYSQANIAHWTIADDSSIKAALDEAASRIVALEGGSAATGEVKVSANDTTAGFLENKIVGLAGKIAVSTLNDAGDEDLQLTIGTDVFDKTADDSDDVTEGIANLFFTDERAQDAVGTILTDTSSIDFTYNDPGNQITAVVLPAGVDHDQLLNFVGNEHIDHSSVLVETQANSGLAGGGDITASRQLVINPMNAPSVSAAVGDQMLVADASDVDALKRVSVQSIVDLASAASSSPGDISETSFAIADNQSTPASITGLAFAVGVVRGFEALITVEINATAGLYEVFKLYGIQKNGVFDMSVESTGDDSGIIFSITNAGQVQYIGQLYAGFVSGSMKFRAITLSV